MNYRKEQVHTILHYTTFHYWLERLSDLRLNDVHRRARKRKVHEIELLFEPGLMSEIHK